VGVLVSQVGNGLVRPLQLRRSQRCPEHVGRKHYCFAVPERLGVEDVLVDGIDRLQNVLSVRSRNQRSTRLSHELEVGVKWKWKRGCLASQARTLGWLWVP
jgi:hypothetical protein